MNPAIKELLRSIYQVFLLAAMAGIVLHLVRPVVRIDIQHSPAIQRSTY